MVVRLQLLYSIGMAFGEHCARYPLAYGAVEKVTLCWSPSIYVQ